jgi:hypothetical protein
MNDRPTLEEQIRGSKMTYKELVDCLMPHGVHQHIDFWFHNHCQFLWRLVRWNWFNLWTGEKGFWLFAKHGFKEWKDEL